MPIQKYPPTDDDLKWMNLAIEVARRSKSEAGRAEVEVPKVGVVIVKDGVLLGSACRGETGENHHAEYGLLEHKLKDVDLRGATAYTTLEPCSKRGPEKTPCAKRLVERGIRRVFIGTYDNNPQIFRQGWQLLRDAGIELRDFPQQLREAVTRDNAAFQTMFNEGFGVEGTGKVGAMHEGAHYTIRETAVGSRTFVTGWGVRDTYVFCYKKGNVALARGAKSFDEIDDPLALDFANNVPAKPGEIVIFREPHGCALVKVDAVMKRVDGGGEVSITWELRLP